jgi:hypothetical protein
MSANGTSLIVDRVPAKQLSALKEKATRLGVTVQGYMRQLIADDLEMDRIARTTPLSKLAEPFQKGLGDLSDEEINQIVKNARARERKRSAARKR